MCYTSLFYLITIFQMNLIIAGLHLPHRVSHPKNMEEQTCRNKKWHNVPMEGILSSLPWITDCFLSLWITFYTLLLLSQHNNKYSCYLHFGKSWGIFCLPNTFSKSLPRKQKLKCDHSIRKKNIKEDSPHGNQIGSNSNDAWTVKLSREKPWAELRF